MSSGAIICQFCSENLDNLPLTQRQLHYNRHLNSSASTGGGYSIRPTFENRKRKKSLRLPCSEPKKDDFWYSSLQTAPPRSFTPGLIPLLRKILLSSHSKGRTIRAVLCFNKVVHVAKEPWDATWGCGYRNFLMLCTALMDQSMEPGYCALLDGPKSPGIRNLQHWIEDAWKAGFDHEGADELKKLVGTNKWIGTSDLYTAFVYRGIPCHLAEFENLKRRGSQPVVDWLLQYFSAKPSTSANASVYEVLRGASPIVGTELIPLIMQHQGHSRVVVGYEVLKSNDINLLIFDSGRRVSSSMRQESEELAPTPNSSSPEVIHIEDTDDDEIVYLGEKRRKGMKIWSDKLSELTSFRLPVKKLREDKYQILYFPLEPPLTEKQKSRMKVVTSDKF